jgi:hypothetical protein
MISSKSHCHNINDYATILRKRCNTVGQGNEIIPFHQKLKRVANNRQAGPQRWLSLPALFNEEQRLEDFTQCITGYTLRRARGEGTISSHCKDKIIITVSLAYQRVENVEHLDANNYIYLGSMKNVVSLQQGLTLDDNGHLLLIKGKSKNFIKQAWAKLHAGTKFYMARIELAKGGPCFFPGYGLIQAEDLSLRKSGQTYAMKSISLPPMHQNPLIWNVLLTISNK